MTRTVFSLVLLASLAFATHAETLPGRWPEEKAKAWLETHGWLRGCNFSPSSAINQLEMWQAETFDPDTIDRELGWAEQLGFNSVRVFLHQLPWQQDAKGFTQRIEKFLNLCEKHKIGVLVVLFDSCWDPFPKPGKQHEPTPFLHNSGWVQSPGLDVLMKPERHDELKDFVQGVIRAFKDDKRIHGWDVFNEPDNTNQNSYGKHEPKNKPELALKLLAKTVQWAREVNPSQPLTSAPWWGDWSADAKLNPIQRLQFDNSDVISFHAYGHADDLKTRIGWLKRYNRPILCTEYMARPVGSTFDPHFGIMKSEKVAAYNWGFVSGKTQTIYPWDSWERKYTAEPPTWFHDIFRTDGTPYIQKEVDYIKNATK